MDNLKLKTIYTEKQLLSRVKELGKEINAYYGDREYIVIAVLKGSLYFLSDLTRELSKKIIVDFMAISSYFGHEKKQHSAKVVLDVNTNIQNKDVLIVEDIIDSGETMSMLIEMFELRKPKSIRVVSLLVKDTPDRKKPPFKVHWQGFPIENEFVIGYGLDYKNNYRNINAICKIDYDGDNK